MAARLPPVPYQIPGYADLPVGLGTGKLAPGTVVLVQSQFLDAAVSIPSPAVITIGAGVFDANIVVTKAFLSPGETADFSLARTVRAQVFDDAALQIPSATATLGQGPAAEGTVVAGAGTVDLLFETDAAVSTPGGFSLRMTDPSATPFQRWVALTFEPTSILNQQSLYLAGAVVEFDVPP